MSIKMYRILAFSKDAYIETLCPIVRKEGHKLILVREREKTTFPM